MHVQIKQVCERFEELETTGGNETERELGELKNDVKKLESQIPSKLVEVNPADSQPRRNPWLDGSINHNSNQDNINMACYENMLHSLHKDAKFDHITALQQCKLYQTGPKKKIIIYWWIGEGFLPPNPEDQKTKAEIALGKTEEDFGNEILGELIAKDFIEPIYKNCSLFTNSYRMLPLIRSVVTIMAERFWFSPVYTLGPDTPNFAQYNEYQCLLNVDATIIDGGPKLFLKMDHFKILYLGRWQRYVTHHIEVADAKILHGLKNMNQLRLLSLRGISLIAELPQFISWLTRLKILDLKACHNLEVVPDGIGLLKNLTHLDMSECHLLEHMPKGIGSLSQLQVLKGFIIGHSTDEKSCTIDDLTKLTKLRKLSTCMSTTTEFSTNKPLGLEKLKTLQKLKISWPGYNLQGETVDTLELERAYSQSRAMELPCSLKVECPRLTDFPCDEIGVWMSNWRNQDNINKVSGDNILHSLHKDPKFEHTTTFQRFKDWWIGKGFLPQNPEDQKTKEEIVVGKMEEDFGNEISGELIAKDFIEPIYKNCSLVTSSYRMLPFIHSALMIMAEGFGFSSVYILGPGTPTLAKYNEYQCLLNVGAAIIDGGPILFWRMNHFKILYLRRWQRLVTHHIEVADTKIFHGLKNMNQLRFLSLRGISLITQLPQCISRLTSLKILDLKACHKLELVPNGIGYNLQE
ncbi:unnamed protein product [Camellia sinensis]